MMNRDKELKNFFEDPLLADVTAQRKRTTSSDRLISGFQEFDTRLGQLVMLDSHEGMDKGK